jgi:hypothetical protein
METKNMASFCRDCSIKIFGKDFGDFKHNRIGIVSWQLCEGCGEWIYADWAGRRVERDSIEEWFEKISTHL